MKTIKTLLTILLITIIGVSAVACVPKSNDNIGTDTTPLIPLEPSIPVEPTEPDDSIPLVPLEPSTPIEPEEPIIKQEYLLVGEGIKQNEFISVDVDTKDIKEIIITIVGNSIYDIPVNINNFRVDTETVAYTGVSGTSYLVNHDFTIGSLNAVGTLINTHQGDIRLHTTHKDHGTTHFIKVDVSEINNFGFDFKITTGAFAYLTHLRLDFTY